LGVLTEKLQVEKFLFVSHQEAIDPKEGRIVAMGIREQTVKGHGNIKAILQATGCHLSDVFPSSMTLLS
jgi:enamine deaminase RidA (YjgF/YER057c/UK114 family)